MPKVKSRLTLLSLALALLVTVGAVPLQPIAIADSIDNRIKASVQTVKTGETVDRGAAAAFLIDNWEKALPEIVADIGAYDRSSSAPLADRDIKTLLPVTDVLRAILVNKDSAIREFRTMPGKDKAVRALVWGARSDDRTLRINSTYSLANVLDNTTLCNVLDHLQDKSLSTDGRVNLLQAAMPVAGYAYDENINATAVTVKALSETMAKTKDTGQTLKLIDDLKARADKSINKGQALPSEIADCNSYKPLFGKLK